MGWPQLAKVQSRAGIDVTGFGRPFGLAMDGQGFLYVTDMDVHGIARLSPDLTEVAWLSGDGIGWSRPMAMKIGTNDKAAPKAPIYFNGPHSVAFTQSGSILITTYYTPSLCLVDGSGTLIKTATGVGDINLTGPATTRINDVGRLMITEYKQHCILIADENANLIGTLGGGSIHGIAQHISFEAGSAHAYFDRPHMITQLSDGSYVVADTWNHRLQHFNADFQWQGWLGNGSGSWRKDQEKAGAGSMESWFNAPVAVGAASNGSFIVTDWGNRRLSWFDAHGRHLQSLENLDLEKPYDAQIFEDKIFVADSHHGRLLILNV